MRMLAEALAMETVKETVERVNPKALAWATGKGRLRVSLLEEPTG